MKRHRQVRVAMATRVELISFTPTGFHIRQRNLVKSYIKSPRETIAVAYTRRFDVRLQQEVLRSVVFVGRFVR